MNLPKTLTAFVLLFGLLLFTPNLSAQTKKNTATQSDKLILRTESGTSQISIRCTVIEYNGREITIRGRPNNIVRTYRASRVVEVQTPQTEPHIKGLLEFKNDRIDQALPLFENALLLEQRKWVRREILAMQVRCFLRKGNYRLAGLRFLALIADDADSRHFALIPLLWTAPPEDAALKTEARRWMSDTNETAQLIGCSILLNDAQFGDLAHAKIQKLKFGSSRRIQQLSKAQLWRRTLQGNGPSDLELARWEQHVESMPQDLRGGPHYLLGRAYTRGQQPSRAAMQFLWVPLVYHHDHHLAARSCLEAADTLYGLRKSDDAYTLYREVATRFSDTPFAQEALTVLKSMTSAAGASAPAAEKQN